MVTGKIVSGEREEKLPKASNQGQDSSFCLLLRAKDLIIFSTATTFLLWLKLHVLYKHVETFMSKLIND